MKILSWNVNGLRAVTKKGFLEWMFNDSPDILCLQETKAHVEQLSPEVANPDGYYSYFCSGVRKGYSGVAIYSKTEPISVKRGMDKGEAFDSEGRILNLEYDDFYLLNIYFPNGRASQERLDFKMAFYDALLEHIIELEQTGKDVLICGDYNTAHKEIDLARPRENRKTSGFLPMECAWMDKLCESGFADTLRMYHQEGALYSWWDVISKARDRNVGWRLDYFFVNEKGKSRVKDAYIRNDVFGSDHCPVGIDWE